MFNLLRLFGRKDHIDDAATAYIEGRATDRDQAAIAERAASEPGLRRDLDSIRDTVALLRSVESVKAPRSFLLQEVPVRVRRSSRPRLAVVPAAFAIAAALMVGLLAVGDLADIVRQSNGTTATSESTMSNRAADSTGGDAFATEDAAALAPASSDATSVTISGGTMALATPAAMPTMTAAAEYAASQPEVAGGTELATVVGEVPDETQKSLAPTVEPAASPANGNDGDPASTALALPIATVPAETAELPTFEPAPETAGDGFAVPLWQLQVGFAVFAVVMAGAWMILQRRLTR